MIIVVKHGNDEAKLEKVVSFLEDRGLKLHISQGAEAYHHWSGGGNAGTESNAECRIAGRRRKSNAGSDTI